MSIEADLINLISTVNSRAAATLAPGAIFQGVGEDVSKYQLVTVSVKSTNDSDGIVTMETSLDNITYSGPERIWANTRFGQPKTWRIAEPYFRIKYVNGTTEAEALALTTSYFTDANGFLAHQLDETLIDETQAIITRSVLVGEDENGEYRNIKASAEGNLVIKEEFGRELVALISSVNDNLEDIKESLQNMANP